VAIPLRENVPIFCKFDSCLSLETWLETPPGFPTIEAAGNTPQVIEIANT
jgi:hypothetical protein